MFTGIIEGMAQVVRLEKEGTNVHITFASPIAQELKVDQSVAHNGVCLTVVAIEGDTYTVTAIEETLQRTNLGDLTPGKTVNLERSLRLGDRLDGHMVQGHVDIAVELLVLDERDGSWWITFDLPEAYAGYVVEKGSVAINGISLTVAAVDATGFSAAIIPYTWEHTNLSSLWVGDRVNVEFDIAAKYYLQAIRQYLVQ
jgi:riboflavin synthase